MSHYLADKYVGLVDNQMLKTILEMYQKSLKDNQVKTAKTTKLARKTIWNVLNSEMDVRLTTKRKILNQALKTMPHLITGYLTQRLYESTSESFLIYLDQIYEKMFEVGNDKDFTDLSLQFNNTVERFAGLIYKNKEDEVDGMINGLRSLANSKSVKLAEPKFQLQTSQVQEGHPELNSSSSSVGKSLERITPTITVPARGFKWASM